MENAAWLIHDSCIAPLPAPAPMSASAAAFRSHVRGGIHMAIDIVIKDNHLQFDGINFFRGNANNVQLGSAGEKKTPC